MGSNKKINFDELSKDRQQLELAGLTVAMVNSERPELKREQEQFKKAFGEEIYKREVKKINERFDELREQYKLSEKENMNQKSLFNRAEMKDGGPGIEALRQVAPDVVKRMGYEEGGSIDDQMMMVMTPPMESEMEPEMPMESDGEMEDGYTRFIMEEALSEDEEDMLMSKLEQDEELAMLFDKVIDVAQEFAGSGPVEGPGSGVSDSIPARLSDGEFVFTAKAVEEIGEDSLMSMMKEAEAAADERQPAQEGGPIEENNNSMPVGVQGSMLDTRKDNEDEEPNYTNPLEQPPIFGSGRKR
jgi:actin-related protein